ncbi:DNA repair protein RecO [Candidatus Falkowbacteria bacterium]|nr:DNA repair protein RecO [Candidatus Falkowbacteria bacterium]
MTRLTKGIILRKQDYRESDRLFVIYTNELGKIEAVAKGVRKIKSKMAGHLELFSIINLMVAPGKTYYQIAGAEREKNFLNIKSDLGKTVLGSFCLEVVDIFTKTDHPDLKIYELLYEILEIFDNGKMKNFLKMYSLSKFFTLKLLSSLGWTPELYTCVKCKKKIMPSGNFFDASRGGLTCGQCGKSDLPISTAAIKILRFVLQKKLKDAAALKITKTHIKELVKIIDAFMAMHQDKAIKSTKWISYLTGPLGI